MRESARSWALAVVAVVGGVGILVLMLRLLSAANGAPLPASSDSPPSAESSAAHGPELVRRHAAASETPVAGSGTEAESSPARRAATVYAEAGDDDMFSPALLAYASERMRASWRRHRNEEMPAQDLERGMQAFRKGVLELPGGIGYWRADDRTKLEAAVKNGEAFRALQELAADPRGPHLELVQDRKRFAELFVPGVRGSPVDGVSSLGRIGEVVRDGTTLSFPAGVFRLRDLLSSNTPFPRDVTVQGAGMDATLLLADGLHCSGPLRNLTLAECTIFSNGDLIDQRSTPAALRLSRVRVIGFDCGAGGSTALNTAAAALLVEGCRFEGGYGRRPNDGTLMRTDALLARFERCVFERIRIGYLANPSAIVFADCVLRDLPEDPRRDPRDAVFLGCRFEPPTGPYDQLPRRNLNDLFPDWQKRVQG